jgi:hypothetical protein
VQGFLDDDDDDDENVWGERFFFFALRVGGIVFFALCG